MSVLATDTGKEIHKKQKPLGYQEVFEYGA